ncbi:TWiK family of potassium channels protein 18-like isoform X1 [Tachypleus tridentatus]|uniref:TWiK family of potassium channels protein 18-like isoform X1 n=1 Tax=Tachypleus tridentatus TaxID=6853 RepID=UPI003FD0ECEE
MSTSPYPTIVQPQWPVSGDQKPVYYRQPSTMSRTSPTGPDHTPQIWLIDPSDFYDLGDKTKTAAVTIAERLKAFSKKWFTHILLFIVLMTYASVGAVIFRLLEGPHESPEIIDLPDVRNVMADILWNISRIYNISEEEWQSSAHLELKNYEGQVFKAISSSASTIDEARQWTFFGSLFFCGTVYTTIGYGNIAPSTTAGRAATIVYAFIGIPLLLMVLADLGKLFTRAIKFLFFFIRQFYYTGKCRKMRKAGRRATAVPVQYMAFAWKTVNAPYFAATRKSQVSPDKETKDKKEDETKKSGSEFSNPPPEPGNTEVATTPAREEPPPFEIDDEFNLPISLALILLFLYIMIGAMIFTLWESHWTFFEAFYFVFISMSTIGFGDYVPDHPIYMMATFIYLLFGLALTSMCINVVQEKLSATFEKAKVRIGTTIGLDVDSLMQDSLAPEVAKTEIAEVHKRRASGEDILDDDKEKDNKRKNKKDLKLKIEKEGPKEKSNNNESK